MTSAAVEPPVQVAARPRLVFFCSPSSGRCRRVEAFLAQVLQHRGNHNTFVLHRVEVEERPDLCRRFQVTTVPTLVVVEDKRVRSRLELPSGAVQITKFLRPWLR